MSLSLEIVEMLGQTMAKVVPVSIALALLFSVLAHFWACNPGKPWWRKRELVTDLCYWFLVPSLPAYSGSGYWCWAPPFCLEFATPTS